MDIMEFLKTRRTYRRFEQKPVEPAIAREIMEAARIASPNRMRPRYCLWLSARMKACPAAMIPIPDLPLPT